MSLYDKASLVLIPSGTKAGTVFSQKPTSGDGDFDFTRSSYATRVNSQGLIEKERSNLILQSNNFDTTWSVDDVDTPTSGISGYDGTNDGWLLNISGDTTSQHIKQTISNSGVQTFSVYAKANTLDWMLLYVSTSTLTRGYFDIANGSLGSSDNLIDSKITDAGNGWYRCSITFNESITDARVYLANANNSIVQSSGSIYIQDAQVEQGLVATDVIETTTSAVYEGITDNVPRLDYDGDCPSLLLEPQRINVVPNSEYAGGYSTNGTGTTTDNADTSPEGLNNAFELEDTSNGDYYRIEHYHIFSAGDYTFSAFIKKTTGALSHYSGIQLDVTRKYVIIDTTNGTFNQVTGTTNDNVTIEDFSEDWWRISITNNLTAASHRIAIWPAISENGTGISTNATGSNLYYGLQLEQGSYATSYIPTYGTSVTRNEDICNNAGDSTIFNDSEGVLYAEMSTSFEASSGVKSLSVQYDGNNYVAIYFRDNNSLSARIVGSGNVTQVDTSYATNTLYKIAVSYNSTNVKFYVNGTQVDIETTNTLPTSLNKLSFDRGGGFATNMNGEVKSLAYFNRALTDTELADLTT